MLSTLIGQLKKHLAHARNLKRWGFCVFISWIFNMFCVKKIPEKYIFDRWKKNIKGYEDVDNVRSFDTYGDNSSSVWRLKMIRKFTTLITASATNPKTRVSCEELFQRAREAVDMDIGPIYHSGTDKNVNSGGIVRDPSGLREKGQKNKRKVSIAKRKSNQVKARKKSVA